MSCSRSVTAPRGSLTRPAALGWLTALIAASGGFLFPSAPAAAASEGISVFPIPGARVASPQTQITFRGVAIAALGLISVTGSQSGPHTGKLLADSDGNGASFVPDRPFSAGESVSVTTDLHVVGVRSATGVPSTYSFTIAHPAGGFPSLHWPAAPRVLGDVQGFRSRPDLKPVSVTAFRRGGARSGDIFIAPQFGPLQDGPMILDPNGSLVWFYPLSGNDVATDFRVQHYRGHPVLTWWQGHVAAGVGIGRDMIFDASYRPLATVTAGNGLSADLHDFELTPANTALIIANYPVIWDASSVRGSRRQIVIDSVIQEIDVPTGLVLFQWDSLDHIGLRSTYWPLPAKLYQPFDPIHLNSVELDRDGNLIVSARNTWAAYKVDRLTGQIIWTLGGRHSTFKLAPGTYWAFQHDVRVRAANDRLLTLFDDEAGPPAIRGQSRGIELALDFKHRLAHQVASYAHSPQLLAYYEGNVQQLGDNDDFVGWGEQPFFSEFDQNGRLLFDARMAGANSTYRAYRFPWQATPALAPAVTTAREHGLTAAYVSWNGATDVAYWRLLGGSAQGSLRSLATVRKQSFETTITTKVRASWVQVQALDARRRVLGSSVPVAAR